MKGVNQDMAFEELAARRYSVRQFSDRPVEEDKLRKVLEVANLAPTAKNAQCVRVYVLQSAEALAKVRELSPCTYGAPVVLMFSYETGEAYAYPEEREKNSGAEDCSIVATHVMLEAAELGLGTCWVNMFKSASAKEAFGLPESEDVVLLMDLGYAAEGSKPVKNHELRKPLEGTVKVL